MVIVEQFPNTEVSAATWFVWEIPDWNALTEREVSDPIECGGFLFEILLFPHGNPSAARKGAISLYLNALGPATASDAKKIKTGEKPWHTCASFALTMFNPEHPKVSVSNASHHRFSPRVTDWGYLEFTSLRSAFVPVAPQTQNSAQASSSAPLIGRSTTTGNLTVSIRVDIEVLADPTGTLWHDFQDYDSREATGYTGLVNQGATCYLNSLLQSLYFTRAFRQAVYAIPDASGVADGLQRLFFKLATSHPAVDTTDLTRAFGWDHADAFTQHDVQELARVLMDRVESRMRGTSVDGFLSKLFVGQMKSYIKCLNVPFESSRIEDFWDVQLNVKNKRNVIASFEDYCAPERMEGENQYAADCYGLQDAIKGVTFTSLPPVLHLQLKRYDYDWMRDVEVKINDRFEFPLELDLGRFVENSPESKGDEATAEDNAKRGEYKYSLHGVLVHSGELNVGHYYALIKPEQNGDWFKFDDDRVTRAALHEVLDENFGGSTGSLVQRVTSAYMLVYIRQNALDFVLPDDSGPPDAIAAKVESEIRAEDERQRALAEQQQYMSVRIMPAADFGKFKGPGLPAAPGVPETEESSDAVKRPDVEQPAVAPTGKAEERELKSAGAPDASLTIRTRLDMPLDALSSKIASLSVGEHSLWLAPLGTPTHYAQKPQRIAVRPGLVAEHLAGWANHSAPAIFAGPPSPAHHGVMVFVKRYDAGEGDLRGESVVWVDDVSLAESLAQYLDADTAVYMEATYPRQRETNLLVRLDTQKTASENYLEPADIVILTKDAAHLEAYFDRLEHRMEFEVHADDEENVETEVVTDIVFDVRDPPEQVLAQIARSFACDPTKVQLQSLPSRWRPPVVVRSDFSNFSGLWAHSRMNAVRVYLRKLPVPLVEFEKLVELPVTVFSNGFMNEEVEAAPLLSPDMPVKPALASELGIDDTSRLVVWIAKNSRYVREIDDILKTSDVQRYVVSRDYGSREFTLYAGILPPEEVAARASPEVALATCYHFNKDPSRSYGAPFEFALIPGEPFGETKQRVLKILRHEGDSDRALEKIRFSLVRDRSYEPIYITNDETVLSDVFKPQLHSLGLDHPNPHRNHFHQQAIRID